jgi:hypothetical protein
MGAWILNLVIAAWICFKRCDLNLILAASTALPFRLKGQTYFQQKREGCELGCD